MVHPCIARHVCTVPSFMSHDIYSEACPLLRLVLRVSCIHYIVMFPRQHHTYLLLYATRRCPGSTHTPPTPALRANPRARALAHHTGTTSHIPAHCIRGPYPNRALCPARRSIAPPGTSTRIARHTRRPGANFPPHVCQISIWLNCVIVRASKLGVVYSPGQF